MHQSEDIKEFRFPKELVKKSQRPRPIQAPTHLITKLIKGQEEQDDIDLCKYGLWCSHLRSVGICRKLHYKNHYLFLNLAPPANCLEGQEMENKLSKKQRKQNKIMEKTIIQHVNFDQLVSRETQMKKIGKINKKMLTIVDENEKRVVDLVSSASVSDLYEKLNLLVQDNVQIYAIKSRCFLQLKKKNPKLYEEAVDKQYRIANRLIKAVLKQKNPQLSTIFQDINHDSIPSVRDHFAQIFNKHNLVLVHNDVSGNNQQSFPLKRLLLPVFLTKPEHYLFHLYSVNDCSPKDIKSNIQFYNLLVPFSIIKSQAYNKFIYIDCQQLSLKYASNLLNQMYMSGFYLKLKAFPEYPFGNLKQNCAKFQAWASKVSSKLKQIECQYRLVIFLNNLTFLQQTENTLQFQIQRIHERTQVLKSLKKIFNIVYIGMNPQQADKAHLKSCLQQEIHELKI